MKTIETTITWYDTSEILPNNDSKCLFICGSGYIMSGNFYGEENRFRFYECCNNWKLSEIKYWAYLPNLEITNE